ncbi:hypothetical protein VTN02DRAFT_1783 [Thermoascus thermophilus]
MSDKAAFQVIVLGPNGGPREDNVTGLLVRSASTEWSHGSVVAVDAGTLLAGIIRTLERYITETKDGKGLMKEGPFVGLDLPNETAPANAAYIFREIIGAVLITHPHLDHLSGLAINTPLVEAGSGPKTVAALPSVIAAIKDHMFNDIIWPNLSDEDGGAGLITYQRLVEGGNPRFGRGDARGYVRACEGLLTKCLSVSHGRCRQKFHPETGKHHRLSSSIFATDPLMLPSPRGIPIDHAEAASIYPSPTRPSHHLHGHHHSAKTSSTWASVESSAFFIRDRSTGNEVIVFGDVEPDSVSIEPRNKRVWEVAAPKVASGSLRAIFIECSFNDSVDDHSLYGHLCPRHLVAELRVLARMVLDIQRPLRASQHHGKRKREDTGSSDGGSQGSPRTTRPHLYGSTAAKHRRKSDTLLSSPTSRTSSSAGMRSGSGATSTTSSSSRFKSGDTNPANLPELVHDERTPSTPEPVDVRSHADDPHTAIHDENPQWATDSGRLPLTGLSVYIIHIKDTLTDGPPPGNQILQELKAHGEAAGLGCEFYVPKWGEEIWI